MHKRSRALLFGALVVSGSLLVACRKEPDQGPAERAGERIDEGLKDLGEKMEEAGEEMQEKARGD